jgi:hypothetical protein
LRLFLAFVVIIVVLIIIVIIISRIRWGIGVFGLRNILRQRRKKTILVPVQYIVVPRSVSF